MKQLILFCTVFISFELMCQIAPAAGGQGSGSIEYWSRSGNNQNGSSNNIFGTRWNSPIYTVTGGITPLHLRMKLNGQFFGVGDQYEVNGYDFLQGVNTTGYLLLGFNNNSMANGQNIYSQKGAFSLLHLNGPGSVYQEFGYRPWMQTGITLTGNKDLSYFGLRKLSTNPSEEDITETVILWSDNNGSTEGPDHLVFRFSGHGGSDGGSVSTNRLSNTDLDGLHVATFTGVGFMGLGNTFGTNATGMAAANYINPQSILHASYDYRAGSQFSGYGFHQITYRREGTTTIGTGETQDDGLRWGIDNNLFTTGGTQHLNAYLRWQENSPFIFQTDWDNTVGGTANGERMRIHSTAAPGVPAASMMPVNTNVTRIAMSYIGSAPITQPRTLLHMGANNGGVPGWMEYGAMTANATQAAFIGITPTDYIDANHNVVGFWNNHLIFLGNPGEVGRFSFNNGYMGVGDFGSNGLAVDPQQRIDVDGNGRFRIVPADGGQSIILGIEQGGNPDDIILSRLEFPNDPTQVLLGDGTWGNLPPGGPGIVSADNALTINPLSNVQWGQINTGLGTLNGGELIHNTEIPMNGFNVSFPGMGTAGVNRFQIGAEVPVGSSAKFYVSNNAENNAVVANHDGTAIPLIAQNTASIQGNATNFLNNNPTNFFLVSGVEGFSSNLNSMNSTGVNGVAGVAIRERVGVQGSSRQPQSTSVCSNFGGRFYGANAPNNYGVFGEATGNVMNGLTIGVLGRAIGTNQSALYAGYFDGDLVYTGANYWVSDIALKLNISQEYNVLNQVMLLNPVNYNMNTDAYSNMGLSQNLQHGFISQEVQEIFPELVQTIIHPAQYDSLGVEISPQMEFLGLNYNGFISLNTAAIIELNEKVIEQEAQINDLNARLATLENCLLGILPMLCQMNNALVAPTPEALQQQMRSMIDVELRNELAIVLDQNVPNPFAETTVITYSIPAAVTRAQIHFYDASGNLIKSVEITERGDGQLNVFGQDLSSGLYTYTLVADGQLIATKKMVKQ